MAVLSEADLSLIRYLGARLREALAAIERLEANYTAPPEPPPPWEESGEEEALPKAKGLKRDAAEKVAAQLNEIYPHGWSEAGKRRPPGLTQCAAALRKKRQKGIAFEVIVEGCRRFRAAVEGSPDQQYSKALFRWVRDELWNEIPEDVREPARRLPSPEEVEQRRLAAEDERRRHLALQAERAGVRLDPETGSVLDWGPGGRPIA